MNMHRFISDITSATRVLRSDRYAQRARVSVRTEAFRARCKIKPLPLSKLVKVAAHSIEVPDPSIDIAGVGGVEFYYTLGALARVRQPKVVIEIGTFLGVGTLALAMNTEPNTKIITIDLPPDHRGEGLVGTDLALANTARDRCGEAFRDTPYSQKITQIRADSTTLNLPSLVPRADLVLIDGGHSFNIIKTDTVNARSVITDEGLIIWDDYWWFYPDVIHYLDQLADTIPLNLIEGTNLVIHQGTGHSSMS
jgi:hypothetical protein